MPQTPPKGKITTAKEKSYPRQLANRFLSNTPIGQTIQQYYPTDADKFGLGTAVASFMSGPIGIGASLLNYGQDVYNSAQGDQDSQIEVATSTLGATPRLLPLLGLPIPNKYKAIMNFATGVGVKSDIIPEEMKKTKKKKLSFGGFTFKEDPTDIGKSSSEYSVKTLTPDNSPLPDTINANDGEVLDPTLKTGPSWQQTVGTAATSAFDFLRKNGGKIAQGMSNGLDVVNGFMGVLESQQQARELQERMAQSRANYSTGAYTQDQLNQAPVYTKYGAAVGNKIEAEGGEITQHTDGSIIGLKGPTHEQGGIGVSGVERVLENTAGRRKDKLSKALLIEGTSHAKLFDKEAKKLEKQQGKYLKAIDGVEKQASPNRFAMNSAKLNSTFAQMLPTKTDIFDALFAHQEVVKQDMGYTYDDGGNLVKFAYGGPADKDEVPPYKGGKKKTPTGKDNGFNGNMDALTKTWEPYMDKGMFTNAGLLQTGIYDNPMQTKQGRDQLRNMWKEYGNTEQGQQQGIGKGFNFKKLDDKQLATLKPAYIDGLAGARTLAAKPQVQPNFDPIASKYPAINLDPYKNNLKAEIDPNRVQAPAQIQAEGMPVLPPQQPKEETPGMRWYDLASSLAAFAGARPEPELFNPAEVHKVKLQQNDVRPYLAANQAQYNAAVEGTAPGSIGAAQAAQLFASKTGADNQALAQVQQANTAIGNQEAMYNTQADDKQSVMDQAVRESYYDKVQTQRAKIQEQRLQAVDAFAASHAKHDSFYRNVDLIQKLAPHFNKNAEYNGKASEWIAGASSLGMPAGAAGQQLYQVKTKDGKVSMAYMTPEEYRIKTKDPNTKVTRIDINKSKK